jgi:hypothetical protein
MHPIGTPRGTPSPGAPADFTSRQENLGSPISRWDELSTNPTIHVLSVGRIETDRLMYDALLDSPDFRISFVHDYHDLWISSKQHIVNAVVMHNTLCSFELAEAARLVRNRWPNAKILLIRSGEVSLDRALYDQCLHPPVKQEALVEQVRILTESLGEGGNSGNR